MKQSTIKKKKIKKKTKYTGRRKCEVKRKQNILNIRKGNPSKRNEIYKVHGGQRKQLQSVK